ncbi:MAG TPA: hypothetical protein VE422_39330 [Terriglobia bacterium]|nr:hypothetical protein [Terriglobia bacterium]
MKVGRFNVGRFNVVAGFSPRLLQLTGTRAKARDYICLIVALLCLAQKPVPEVVPPPPNIAFTTHLDRTAAWVGDQFHYLIIVDYPSDYQFVLDNLTKETVNMDPFQVMDVRPNLVVQKNTGRKLFVDLTLANFVTAETSMQIPQFTLYYFQKDKNAASVDQADAESLTIPGPVIGIRSTLPPQPNDIRDAITLNSWSRVRWALPAVAWICFAVLVIGFGRELALFVRRMKARKGPNRRMAMEAVRARWMSGIPSEFTDPKTCSSFYDQCYQSLKEYIGYYLDTSTMGLTAEEMRAEMQRLGARADLTERVARVLEACETLRYTRDGVSANTEAARAVAQDMREILSAGR